MPNCALSIKMMQYIPAPVRRQYAREKLAERAAFAVYLRGDARKLPGHFNETIGQYLGLAVPRRPYPGCKKIYWLLYLRRQAGI